MKMYIIIAVNIHRNNDCNINTTMNRHQYHKISYKNASYGKIPEY